MRVVLFENVCNEILGLRGNKWNSRRFIDANMLSEMIKRKKIPYDIEPIYEKEADDLAYSLEEMGVREPCIVLHDNKIAWRGDSPVIFNVRAVDYSAGWPDGIFEEHKKLQEGEIMLTYTHSPGYDYAHIGHFLVLARSPRGDSAFCDSRPVIAKTMTRKEMLDRIGTLSLEKLDDLPEDEVTTEPADGFKVCTDEQKPVFLLIDGKILVDGKRRPYLYNAKAFVYDSYTMRAKKAFVIYDDEDRCSGYGIECVPGRIENWR